MRENEIVVLQKEKELKEKTITLAQSVLVQVSKLSENIRNSSFSKDPQVLLLKQDLDRLSELSTSFSELDIQNDVAYSEFDYLFDKIPSLAPLNQTERKILILTIMGSRPKEIGSVLALNDQYVRNVKSKIKKLLPEEMQNVEWDQLRKLK
jgi:DNA-binding CsgD family transcriptional regulator